MDPDPSIFITDFRDANKKKTNEKNVFCILLFEVTFPSKIKNQKEETKQ
jgi:hypothetical protein